MDDHYSTEYKLRISRLTVDKLGVKLYDKASAVVAELIANSYDADAENVLVRLPLGTILAARKGEEKELERWTIEVIDDGHGMTPIEAQDYYLQVGRDRRKHDGQGAKSRNKKRAVMGRKGIGKLAPFGICKKIEVLSAGEPKTEQGYLVTHFVMDYDNILSDTDEEIILDRGSQDRTYRDNTGTTIRLFEFLPKLVPNAETFRRQLATRFIFARSDFTITVEDTRDPTNNPASSVKPIEVAIVEDTKIDLANYPLSTSTGERLQVTGWLAMANVPYKNEELAGVRIYARNKIVATTRDFEQPAGFTGEFTIRSYLVGEVFAEWLDLDEGEDLIRSDRQGILWDSDYGRSLREWGAQLIKRIGATSRAPRRERTRQIFIERSNFERLARSRYSEEVVVEAAMELAKQIGGFAAEDELEDQEYVEQLSNIILSVAPHKALIEAFQEFNTAVDGEPASLSSLLELFNKTRIAEMASYSQVAYERVRAIRELEAIIMSDVQNPESEFQKLISRAPWLIEPTWTVISKNQALKTFKVAFERWWRQQSNETISLSIGEEFEDKRPDFTLISVNHTLHIIEIKKAHHHFNDGDFERLLQYVHGFRKFFEENNQVRAEFGGGWRIILVADGERLTTLSNKESFEHVKKLREVERISWIDFLTRAKKSHEEFLEINDRAQTKRQAPEQVKQSG